METVDDLMVDIENVAEILVSDGIRLDGVLFIKETIAKVERQLLQQTALSVGRRWADSEGWCILLLTIDPDRITYKEMRTNRTRKLSRERFLEKYTQGEK